MEDVPFPDLQIDPSDFLNEVDGRALCPKCEKSRKYYCYNCYVPTKGLEDRIPRVKLPLNIDIIKHPNECDGKSTSAHAAVLAPDHVNVYTYPCIPDFENPDQVVLLFPGPNSSALEDLAENCRVNGIIRNKNDNCNKEGKDAAGEDVLDLASQFRNSNSECKSSNVESEEKIGEKIVNAIDTTKDLCKKDTSVTDTELIKSLNVGESVEGVNSRKKGCKNLEENSGGNKEVSGQPPPKKRKVVAPFNRAVFIDSTWNQTKRISSDERLKGLKTIELTTRETKFWRHQKDNPSTYLSTIEAIYYLVRDYHDLFVPTEYDGEYDNLLFFFSFMYQKITKMYNGGKDLKAFKQRSEMKQKSGKNKKS